jgi:hypothetical protein
MGRLSLSGDDCIKANRAHDFVVIARPRAGLLAKLTHPDRVRQQKQTGLFLELEDVSDSRRKKNEKKLGKAQRI